MVENSNKSERSRLVYVAHPYGGAPRNLALAEQFVAELNLLLPDCIFWAPWIPLCRDWPNKGESLKEGMRFCLAAVARSDAFIGCNIGESVGGTEELREAVRLGKPYCIEEGVQVGDLKRHLDRIKLELATPPHAPPW